MKTIALLNDAFPPMIDGVANVMVNYADQIRKNHDTPIVIAPDYPYADDSGFDYEVIRFRSIDITSRFNVVAGIPFAPKMARQLKKRSVDLLHSHCPFASQIISREMRQELQVPLIMTYHTKYDVDINKVIKEKLLRRQVITSMMENVSASDEIWCVSHGAAEHMKSLGYEGDCIVMENGVDLPHARPSESRIRKVTKDFDLPKDVPVFLFVGRMMWYKGIRLIVDALAGLQSMGLDFRMVFVGIGTDFPAIEDYIRKSGIAGKCIFPGAVTDREELRAWYSRADLQLFPSTFDTNGLVVREAAACSTPSVLIEGSCAAEGVIDGRNGYLIPENAVALALKIDRLLQNRETIRQVGENAGNEIYISWADAVKKADARYDIVIDNYKRGLYPKRKKLSDEIYKSLGKLMSLDLSRVNFR